MQPSQNIENYARSNNTRTEKFHKATRAQVAAKTVPKRNRLIQETFCFLNM